ncbi:MAG: family 78 glycoside hydrolase catalytic domain [Bacteroidales bacterium]|nr:family 78 glycoside hydrolase catalytic domain [Bacteroidales bacterium]
MRYFIKPLVAALLACILMSSCGSRHLADGTSVAPYALRTDLLEYTDTDFGEGRFAFIKSGNPVFSWIVPSIGDSTVQLAYRITVNKLWPLTPPTESFGTVYKTVWDSGWVEGDSSVAVPFQGSALEPGSDYEWAVELKLANASGKRLKTSKSAYKRFKTDKTVCDYSTPSYPLVAERQAATAGLNSVYDFGKAAFGKLDLTLTAAADDSVMVIIGERLKDGHIEHTPRISSVVYDEIGLKVKAGKHTYLVEPIRDGRNTGPQAVPMPDYAGVVAPFRYCEIRGDVSPVKVERISYHYPFDENAASFCCSNDTLNAIWDLCHYSLKPCSFTGIWVDGNRERIPYEYDALIAQLCHYGSDAEYSIDRRTLEWLLTQPTWPTEWILYAVEIAWNDYLWTGDDRALKANYEVLKAHGLDALCKENGLVSTTQGQSPEFLASINRSGDIKDIVDWPHTGILGLQDRQGGEDDGFVYTDFNAVVNALYYRTLLRLAEIADRVGNDAKSDANLFRSKAEVTRKAFQKAFFNPATGIYKDGIETDHSSLHTNMMAILCGLTTPENETAVANFVESRGLRCSIFGAHNLLQSLYAAGRGDAALHLMTSDDIRSWYNGIRAGTTITIEAWDDSFKPNQDWNHIAGAAPGNAIPFGLMGITPLEPGFARVTIRPQPGNLGWAEITVPTIRGSISVSIGNGRMEVVIPANMTAEIYLPSQNTPTATVGSGRFVFNY